MTVDNEYLEPLEVQVKKDEARLYITWSDGHQGWSGFLYLRWNCPCAGCKGEMGVPGRLAFVKELSANETVMVGLEPVGLYALKPIWQDGHETGLYTYQHLRNLCQCEVCMGENPAKFEGYKLKSPF
jgi:DUF971 family protein